MNESLRRVGADPGSRGMRLRWRVTERLDECREAWLALEPRGALTPFQRFAWVEAYVETLGREAAVSPRIALGTLGGEIAAILPLGLERRWGARSLTWLGWPVSNYNAPLVAPDAWPEIESAGSRIFGRALRPCLPGAAYLYLAKQPACLAGRANPFVGRGSSEEPHPAFMRRLDPIEGAAPVRSPKTLRRLQEKRRRLERSGTVSFEEPQSPEAKRNVVSALVAWKRQQLAGRGGLFDDCAADDFLCLAATAPVSPVRLLSLCLNGEPLSVIYALAQGDWFVVYQIGYANGPHARHSPGTLLLYEAIRRATAEGFRLFDLSIGREPYKEELCDIVAPQFVSAAPLKVGGAAPAILDRGVVALRRLAETQPIAERGLRRIAGWLRRVPGGARAATVLAGHVHSLG